MNQLNAKVEKIQKVKTLHLVTFKLKQQTIKMLSLELPPTLKIDSSVILEINPSNIILTPFSNQLISSANQLKAEIKSFNKGEILVSVSIEIDNNIVESLISLEAFEELKIKENNEVIAIINLSEVSVRNAK